MRPLVVAMLATTLLCLTARPAAAASGRPSFDCAQARQVVETVICGEARLAALDRKMAALHERALVLRPAYAAAIRQDQAAWLRKRNRECSPPSDVAPCLDGIHRGRIAELTERNETYARPPAAETYAGFLGRWRVVGLGSAVPLGAISARSSVDYVGLEFLAAPGRIHWLNEVKGEDALGSCRKPSFAARAAGAPLAPSWRAATLRCQAGEWPAPFPVTLRSDGHADLEWGDTILLLERRPPGAPISPPPAPNAEIPPLTDYSIKITEKDRAFFRDLRSAVRRRDKAWLAAHIGGAVAVNRKSGGSYVYASDEVIEAYDWIITPKVAQAILSLDKDVLWKNYRGVAVGNGVLWFEGVAVDGRWEIQILAINQ